MRTYIARKANFETQHLLHSCQPLGEFCKRVSFNPNYLMLSLLFIVLFCYSTEADSEQSMCAHNIIQDTIGIVRAAHATPIPGTRVCAENK